MSMLGCQRASGLPVQGTSPGPAAVALAQVTPNCSTVPQHPCKQPLPTWPTAADGAEWPWAAIMPGTLAPEPHRTTQDCLPPARPCCKEPPQRGMSMVRRDQPCYGSLPKWEANAYKFILANISQLNQERDQNSTSKGIHRMLPYWEKLDWQLTSALSSFF